MSGCKTTNDECFLADTAIISNCMIRGENVGVGPALPSGAAGTHNYQSHRPFSSAFHTTSFLLIGFVHHCIIMNFQDEGAQKAIIISIL